MDWGIMEYQEQLNVLLKNRQQTQTLRLIFRYVGILSGMTPIFGWQFGLGNLIAVVAMQFPGGFEGASIFSSFIVGGLAFIGFGIFCMIMGITLGKKVSAMDLQILSLKSKIHG